MEYHFALCDDDASYARHVADLVRQWSQRTGARTETEQFPSAEAFLFRYSVQKDFDVLLLDVEMGAMDGVALARAVREDNDDIQIVFITGYSDYISQGYEVSALHYLTKPVVPEKLFQVLNRAVSRLSRNEPRITLELPGETLRLPLGRISCLEVLHNYVTVHADQDYIVKRPLGQLEKDLDSRFFRISRSCILNLTFIRRVTRTQVELLSGLTVPLPRGQYDRLNRAIIQRLSG